MDLRDVHPPNPCRRNFLSLECRLVHAFRPTRFGRPALAAALLALAACGGGPPHGLVDGVLRLPRALREVSGITAVDGRTIACVQDEDGTLYFVDLVGERGVRAVPFGAPGDYEGLARVGDDFWVLRSDGLLLRLVVAEDRYRTAERHRIETPDREFEALCFDAPANRLLILPKHLGAKDKHPGSVRPVYAFELASRSLAPEPVCAVRAKDLRRELKALAVELPPRTTARGRTHDDLELYCSELSTMPGSHDLLLLSAVDGVLLRIDRGTGRLLGALPLDAETFPQPEGMTFLPDGRLLVASEGGAGEASVRVVQWR